MVRLAIEFADTDELRSEFEKNFDKGGAFVCGASDLDQGDACEVDIVHPTNGATLTLPAMVVWVERDQRSGVGLAFTDFDRDTADRLWRFITDNAAPSPNAPPAPTSSPPPSRRDKAPLNVHERLRGLSGAAQMKVAREGEIHERIVLERLYGKAVWDALLRNPRLTHPEVARIARMGALPRPQLELILANPGWLCSPQVRRALLANPRLSREMVLKVLRATPKHELKLVPKQTAYPAGVRQVARRLLKG